MPRPHEWTRRVWFMNDRTEDSAIEVRRFNLPDGEPYSLCVTRNPDHPDYLRAFISQSEFIYPVNDLSSARKALFLPQWEAIEHYLSR